jgi:hypothetical protein
MPNKSISRDVIDITSAISGIFGDKSFASAQWLFILWSSWLLSSGCRFCALTYVAPSVFSLFFLFSHNNYCISLSCAHKLAIHIKLRWVGRPMAKTFRPACWYKTTAKALPRFGDRLQKERLLHDAILNAKRKTSLTSVSKIITFHASFVRIDSLVDANSYAQSYKHYPDTSQSAGIWLLQSRLDPKRIRQKRNMRICL